ncbi:MAG TPA: GxxExxY protein [Saprospiraceae bacterium]|nr:GxxExxY protein [Saprospiraceae bacterium]HND86789.1 GxxExxY protein [Saprospiraceae bacterium]
MHENEISKIVIDAALEVHRAMGPGMLEAVYEEALAYELSQVRGLQVERQRSFPVIYKGVRLAIGYRADLIVEGKVIIELKSVEMVLDVHKKTLLTYLMLTHLRLGLLINFNNVLLKNGITRIVNGLQ